MDCAILGEIAPPAVRSITNWNSPVLDRRALEPSVWTTISGAQVRAARALLRWTAKELARKAKVDMSFRDARREKLQIWHRSNREAGGFDFTNGDAPGIPRRSKPIR